VILVVDNYDSFTWNLVHLLEDLGAAARVARNDAIGAGEALASGPAGILISPGPGRPEAAGVTPALVAACAAARRPLLGICLGHQAIAVHFGAAVVRAPRPMHGKVSAIAHDASGLFAGLPSPFQAVRYNSLTVTGEGLPACLAVTATAEDGTIQGLAHRTLPLHGVQFHPESVASEQGRALLANFLAICGSGTKAEGTATAKEQKPLDKHP
jgi:anthranilate synthase component 2